MNCSSSQRSPHSQTSTLSFSPQCWDQHEKRSLSLERFFSQSSGRLLLAGAKTVKTKSDLGLVLLLSRTSEFSAHVPHLVVTEDREDSSPGLDDGSDSGYGTIPGSLQGSQSPLIHRRRPAICQDPRLTLSTLDLRDIPRRFQSSNPHAPQRRSAPDLPEDIIQRGHSLPRRGPSPWSEKEEEEEGSSAGGDVVMETLNRARLRGQVPLSPSQVDSAGESPWDSSGEDEEESPLFLAPKRYSSSSSLRAEEMLQEIREDLANQRIDAVSETVTEPRDRQPRKLTVAELQRMRGSQIIQLDTPLTTS